MKRIKKLKHKVAALCLSLFLALGLIAPAFSITVNAEAVEVLESSATIADCVMTYYAMTGSAVANTTWINTLYDSLGSSFGTLADFANNGLMFFEDGVWKPAAELAQNIASTDAYTGLGLDTVFNVSVEEAATGGGLAAASGAATLSGAAGCVATHGLLPVLGGVTAAYWGGIAIGTLIAHKVGLYGHTITNGGSITEAEFYNSIPDGSYGCSNGSTHYYANYPLIAISEPAGSMKKYCFVLYDKSVSNGVQGSIYKADGTSIVNAQFSRGVAQGFYSSNTNKIYIPAYNSDNIVQCIANLRNGTVSFTPYSPDMIGENGNLNGNYSDNNYTVPDMKPQIDPQTQSGKPLSLNDWLAFANGVQNNNNGTSPIPNNSSLYQDILDAIRNPIPGAGDDPSTDPGTVPVPTPTPNPDYDVEQPDTNAPESETPETDPNLNPPDFVLPNLMEKFPFCIPNDIATIFGKFRNENRQAPYISWRFNPPGTPIDYTFNLNLSEFESVAALLRTLELIAFVVGLAYATRYLIGSS